MNKSYYKYFLATLGVIIVDQVVKMIVHFNMYLHEEKLVFPNIEFLSFLKFHYILNPGMAFGMEIGGSYGKLILTVFRLLAMVGIAWYLIKLARKNAHPGLLWCIGLILGGAIGNVIDSTFYGVLIEGNVIEGSPTPWFHGQVIDMFYVDICNCYFPKWVPVFGGSYHQLWPIFNVADAAIFVGVAVILVSQKKFFREKEEESANVEITKE